MRLRSFRLLSGIILLCPALAACQTLNLPSIYRTPPATVLSEGSRADGTDREGSPNNPADTTVADLGSPAPVATASAPSVDNTGGPSADAHASRPGVPQSDAPARSSWQAEVSTEAPPTRTAADTTVSAIGVGTGAASKPPSTGQSPPDAPVSGVSSTAASYELNPGDKLHISVWGEQALQQDVVVAPDGTVSFPLVGSVAGAGKTTDQLQKDITDKLAPLISSPSVSVMMLEAAGYGVFVVGEVVHPGEYHSPRPVTVLQAISMAGGLTPFAGKHHIKIVHRSPDQSAPLQFDYAAIEKGNKLETNVVLRTGDTVVVPD